ncbi:MAG: fasciclin domain-containing protein [Bacteroidales bacterium]|nr:fasciclin domain-containing protein [Bacteroidales bacterium]
MNRLLSYFRVLFVLFLSIGFFSSCDDDNDDYYARPTWLGEPVYQQLEQMGDFSYYLACVDKSGYASSLKGAGYYTVFAPDDAAFLKFLSESGIGSIESVSIELAKEIVAYSLAVVPASKDTIDDYKGTTNLEIEEDVAFKRQTYYTRGVYESEVWIKQGENWAKQTYSLVDPTNIVGDAPGSGWVFSESVHNRKHIPFFTDKFMAKANLTTDDYNYLFPDKELTDFNVAGAKVTQRNIWAENGIIHVVDEVILPLDNLDQLLAKTEESSLFSEILNKYMASYISAPNWLKLNYEQSTGLVKDIYAKGYTPLVYSLNSENYLRNSGATGAEEMDAYVNGFSLFAPTNEAVKNCLAHQVCCYTELFW